MVGVAGRSSCWTLNPSPKQWLRWSSPATWPSGIVPGVGSSPEAVTIPCNKSILFDMVGTDARPLQFTTLTIRGHLRFLDDDSVGNIFLVVQAILVTGRLSIGTPKQHFRHQISITLTADRSPASKPLTWQGVNFGRKAVAVVGGGSVGLFGMPGGIDAPAWTFLRGAVQVGATQIRVTSNISSWAPGSLLSLSPSGSSPSELDSVRLASVSPDPDQSGNWVANLASPLSFGHRGLESSGGVSAPGPMQSGLVGVVAPAEVALLSRNVVIQGQPEGGEYEEDGGSFAVYRSAGAVAIEGVEFANMGQAGRRNRYPLLLYTAKGPRMFVSHNSIHDSNNRCITIRGTNNVMVHENVAFNVRGHCFVVEGGEESGLQFSRNLGMGVSVPNRTVAAVHGPKEVSMAGLSDGTPAVFYVASVNNSFIGNTAAGSAAHGFWLVVPGTPPPPVDSGVVALLQEAAVRKPSLAGLQGFSDSVAHSNAQTGILIGPDELRMGGGSASTQDVGLDPTPLVHVVSYGNAVGCRLQTARSVNISGGIFFGNSQAAVIFEDASASSVEDSLVIGRSPSAADNNAKEGLFQSFSRGPSRAAGIVFAPSRALSDDGNHVRNVSFAHFSQTRPYTGALALGSLDDGGGADPALFFQATSSVSQVTFLDDSRPLYIKPSGLRDNLLVLRDSDGSIVGSGGGFVVQDSAALLPPKGEGCAPLQGADALACPGSCYRTVTVTTVEVPVENSSPPFGVVAEITRSVDAAQPLAVTFPVPQETGRAEVRVMNVVAGLQYSIDLSPLNLESGSLTLGYADGRTPCPIKSIWQIRYNQTGDFRWSINNSSTVTQGPCIVDPDTDPGLTYVEQGCTDSGTTNLTVYLGNAQPLTLTYARSPSDAPRCTPTPTCSTPPSPSPSQGGGHTCKARLFAPSLPAKMGVGALMNGPIGLVGGIMLLHFILGTF